MLPYNKLSDLNKQNIIEEYYKKVSFIDIGEKLQVSQRSISRVLKETGINSRLKNRYTLNNNYFEKINSENKAYWLGFLFADGFVGDEHFKNIVLSVSEKDKEHLTKFINEIEYTGDIRVSTSTGYQGSTQYIVNFSSKFMSEHLRNLGLSANKAYEIKTLPSINKKFISHFIRGYFDGDGSISIHEGTTKYVDAQRKEIIYKYDRPSFSLIGNTDYLHCIGHYIGLPYKLVKSKSESMDYLLLLGGKKSFISMFEFLYQDATVYLDRKYNKWQEFIGAPNK